MSSSVADESSFTNLGPRTSSENLSGNVHDERRVGRVGRGVRRWTVRSFDGGCDATRNVSDDFDAATKRN